MKVWGIIATILFLGFAAASGWLYFENDNLKGQLSTKEESVSSEQEKITSAQSLSDTLGMFGEDYFAENADSASLVDLDSAISDTGDRNLEVAYNSLKKASEKEERNAIGNFITEFSKVLTENLGGQSDIQSSETQEEEESNEIEGQGEYSDNIFPN